MIITSNSLSVACQYCDEHFIDAILNFLIQGFSSFELYWGGVGIVGRCLLVPFLIPITQSNAWSTVGIQWMNCYFTGTYYNVYFLSKMLTNVMCLSFINK